MQNEQLLAKAAECKRNGNRAEALKYYQQAVENGDENAMFHAAMIFGYPLDAELFDEQKSKQLLEIAVERRQIDALYTILSKAKAQNADNVKSLEATIMQLSDKLSAGGDAHAMYIGAKVVQESELGKIAPDFAFGPMLEAARGGDTFAMFDVAQFYHDGIGVKPDFEAAIKWLQQAAQNGNHDALTQLYFYSSETFSEQKRYEYLLEGVSRAARAGSVYAMQILSSTYYEGDVVDRDFEKAIDWFENAVKYDDPSNSKLLTLDGDYFSRFGELYLKGIGTEQDVDRARRLLDIAIDKGDDYAQKFIDRINSGQYQSKRTVKKDTNKVADRETLMARFYDDRDGVFKVPLGGSTIVLAASHIGQSELNAAINKKLDVAIDEMKRFYKESQRIEKIVDAADGFGLRLLHEIATAGVDFCAEHNQFTVTTDALLTGKLTGYKSPKDLWLSYTVDVKDAYEKITGKAQAERDYRQQRKDSRGKFVGGGFGLDGAIGGAIEAGALNMMTGAAHSVFNALGNLSTGWNESDEKEKLYQNPRTLQTYVSGLAAAANHIKLITLAKFGLKDIRDKQKQCAEILKNVPRFEGTTKAKALIQALTLDPYNPQAYEMYRDSFGDDNNELRNLATFCIVDIGKKGN